MLTFPSFLRGPLQAGFSRSQAARFVASQPAAGSYFEQIETEDVPSFFTVQFLFKRNEALAFQAWMRQNQYEILNGAQFEIDLSIEDGLVTQVASFTPNGIPQYSGENAGLVSYTAEIVVPRLNIPSLGFEGLILGVAELGGSHLLQHIVNYDMPGA